MTRARKLIAYASLPPPPQGKPPTYPPKPPTPVAQPPSYAPPSKYCASPPGYYPLPIAYCTPGPVVWDVPTPSPVFFNAITGPPLVITPSPPGKNHITVVAVCVSLGGAFLLFLVLGALCFVKKKKLAAAHHGGEATTVGGYGALKSTGPATGGGYGAH